MNQRNKVIELATAEIGYIEEPINKTKYQKTAQPWCGAFVNFIFKKAEVAIPNCLSTQAGALAFKKVDRFQEAANATPEVGDLAFFDFPNDNLDRISHIGIVVKDNGDGTVTCIEGNTSSDVKGNQRNGGEVCTKIRAYKVKNRGKLKPSLPVFVVGFGKPTFKE